jgi:undecaprenyl pyrophosphate synthase
MKSMKYKNRKLTNVQEETMRDRQDKLIENLEKQLQVSKEINQKLIDDLSLQKQYVKALNERDSKQAELIRTQRNVIVSYEQQMNAIHAITHIVFRA